MRGVSGLGIALYAETPPILHVIGTGQSLSVGAEQPVSESTSQPYTNLMLVDSSGNYTTPSAPTWSLQPLTAPVRAPQGPFGTGRYPLNVDGETIEVSAGNALTYAALTSGRPNMRVITSCCGQSGQGIVSISPGGSSGAYEAGILEVTVAKRLVGSTPYQVGAVMLMHGEQDSEGSYAGYGADLVSLRNAYQSAIGSLLGAAQTRTIVVFTSLVGSTPGQVFGPDVINDQIMALATSNPLFVVTGPRYQYEYSTTQYIHMSEYRPCGEKYGQAMHRVLVEGQPWLPLYMTGASRSGTTVTVTHNVPVGPLAWDTRLTGPHGVGTALNAMWGPGKGFEAWDRPLTVASITNATPRVVTFTTPHGLSTGDQYYFDSTANCFDLSGVVWTVTVTGPDTVSLNGSTSGVAYVSHGIGFSPIPITAVALTQPDKVVLTLGRAPIGGGTVAYALHADGWPGGPGIFTGGSPSGRCGLLRDSDPWTVPPRVGGTGFANYNFACHASLPLP